MKLPILFTLAALSAGCSSNSQTQQVHTTAEPAAHAIAQSSSPAQPPTLLPGQPSFASPDEAVQQLYTLSTAKDLAGISRTLGLPESEIVTPDAAHNASHAQYFARCYDEFHNIVPEGDSKARVFIGKNNYPLASPLVKVDGRWFFDSAGGKEALAARYVDENERATIGVCRAFVQAQYEYYAEDRDGDDVLEYAQQLGSTKGKHDGLYWHTEAGEPESPLGPLVAEARASGYLKGSVHKLDEPTPRPYHGYYFQILTRQGKYAPGGAYDYIINNHMIAGFALLAYPAKYGSSGVMTFTVNSNGKVFQKDLGPGTSETAGAMTEYNPDSTWSLVTE